MLVHKAYKYRLKPTASQLELLRQHGGNTRWLWNHFLAENIEHHKQTGKFKFEYEMNGSLPDLKEKNEWLKTSYSQSLQRTSQHLSKALTSCFKEGKGFPRFKSKKTTNDSFAIPQGIKPYKQHVYIPSIGKVAWCRHRTWDGKIILATITQDGDNWYCSLTCAVRIKDKKPLINNIVGIDLGLKEAATLSDGTTIKNPKFLKKHENKIVRAQRKLSRKQLGSSNRNKQRKRLANLHRRVRNLRTDYLHKTTTDMTTKYSGFVLETLNVKGMMQNHKLAKSIGDVSWSEFVRMLEYKSLWYGKHFIRVDRFAPTSKMCSDCGHVVDDMPLSKRIFVCPACGLTIDRDLNAAINILHIGLHTLGQRGIHACGDRCGKAGRKSSGNGRRKQEKESPRMPVEAVA